MSIFVTVGNSKKTFPRLLNELKKLKPYLNVPVVVQHGHTICNFSEFISYSFLDESRYLNYIEASDLIISHAGAGSIISALKLKKNLILVPRQLKFDEHINDHQSELAKFVEKNGLGTVVYEIEQLKDAIIKNLEKSYSMKYYTSLGKEFMINLISQKLENLERKIR